MTSNTMNDAMRSTQPVAIRWRRYLSELAAMQPPPPPAIVRSVGTGRLQVTGSRDNTVPTTQELSLPSAVP
jgi:hypothetical protein